MYYDNFNNNWIEKIFSDIQTRVPMYFKSRYHRESNYNIFFFNYFKISLYVKGSFYGWYTYVQHTYLLSIVQISLSSLV